MAIAAGGAGGGVFFGAEGGSATANSDSNAGATGNATSTAEATGGAGGDGFNLAGGGGAATASSNATSGAGGAASMAIAAGGAGGGTTFGGAGGAATANSDSNAGATGNATSTAEATGGHGIDGAGGGGAATASSNASAAGGGMAMAKAVATGGVGGSSFGPGGAIGAANATSSAETAKGALAQAQSTALGSSGQALSNALTSYSFVKIQSAAVAQVGSTATTNAIAQGGGSGPAFVNPGQTAYAFSTALPDKAYAASLIDGASNVAGALLGPRDMVFGTAILGANYATDGGGVSHTYSGSATFDFGYGGDLMLGLIDDAGFPDGLGFQSMEFTILDNGVEILDLTFESLAAAESFFHDSVINLGSNLGPDIDLTFGYNLVADGSGGFGFDFAVGGAVPEPSTWAMMLLGFAGLGFVGYRTKSRVNVRVV